MERKWYLYVLRCSDQSLYTGITVDIQKRFDAHNTGKGAKYTRGRCPLELLYTEECASHSEALKRELAFKALSRDAKLRFLQNPTGYYPKSTFHFTNLNSCDMLNETTRGGTPMKTSLLIHPEELNRKWIDRMADLGVDTIGLHPRGGNTADQTLLEMLGWLKTAEYQSLLDYAVSKGLSVTYEMHAGTYLLPRDLFSECPQYFRVDEKGERTTKRNFCVSNQDALNIVVENSVTLAKELYDSNNEFYFWMDDGKDLRCHCEKCAELSASDQQLLVMNAIVRELRKIIPDAKVPYLAYYACMEVPTKVKPEEGVFLEFAPIHRKYQQPAWVELDQVMDQPGVDQIKKLLDFFGTKDAKVLEYWYDNSMFSQWKKPVVSFTPNNELIQQDIAFYRSLGFENISSFACFLGEDYEEMYGEPDVSAFQKN